MAKGSKSTKVFTLDGGFNMSRGQNEVSDNDLYYSENVIFEDGKLCARRGLSPISDNYIGVYESTGQLTTPLTVTQIHYSYSGVSGMLAYDIWSDSENYAFINIYLFRDNAAVRSLGQIEIGLTDNRFLMPRNVVFLTGEATNGNGLYVFVGCSLGFETYNNSHFDIYEFTGGNIGFTLISDSEFYIPVIYTNGRGNKYNEARKNGWVFEETPQYPEDVNLLTEKFKAYFTSDGYSGGFKLPLWQLDDTMPAICRVYTNSDSYAEWVLPASTHTATINFNSQQVTAKLDCSTGYVSFTSQGSEYAIPGAPKLNGNNIMIMAHKNLPDSRSAILSSKGAVMFDDKIYFYGNGFYKNEVYCCASDNLFYFPESMKTTVGNSLDTVTAMFANGKNLFAFKEKGVYKITTNEQLSKSEMILPVDVGRNYKVINRLKSTEISGNTGCLSYKTISGCGNKTVFFATDKKVYCISDNGYLSEISTAINGMLSKLDDNSSKDSFCVKYNHNYLLIVQNKGFLMNFENTGFGFPARYGNSKDSKAVKWHYLTFPDTQNYYSGIGIKGEPYIIAEETGKRASFVCKFSGNRDIVPSLSGDTVIKTESKVSFSFKTKSYDFGKPETKKGINFVELFTNGFGNYKIKINGETYDCEHNICLKGDSVVKIMPFIIPCHAVSTDISGFAPFSISKLAFDYTLRQ